MGWEGGSWTPGSLGWLAARVHPGPFMPHVKTFHFTQLNVWDFTHDIMADFCAFSL